MCTYVSIDFFLPVNHRTCMCSIRRKSRRWASIGGDRASWECRECETWASRVTAHPVRLLARGCSHGTDWVCFLPPPFPSFHNDPLVFHDESSSFAPTYIPWVFMYFWYFFFNSFETIKTHRLNSGFYSFLSTAWVPLILTRGPCWTRPPASQLVHLCSLAMRVTCLLYHQTLKIA